MARYIGLFGVALLLLLPVTPSQSVAQDEQFEIEFMQNMIDHHHMAVMMSELCDGRVLHSELGALCDQIMTAQTAEIALMQSWLMAWYNITHEPVMTPEMMEMIDMLAMLTGEDFEIEYMQTMIEHHRQAVEESGDCLQNAIHSELLALCEAMRMDQLEEIALMEGWLCDWFEICGPTPVIPESWGTIKSRYR